MFERNPLCRLLGVAYPVILGAMSRINNPELVAAVSQAGGFGLLVAKNYPQPADLLRAIQRVRELTDRPFGVNLAARDASSPTLAGLLASQGIKAVTTSAGPPDEIVPACHEAGLRVLHVVGGVRGALRAQNTGVDAVIAEGGESGGLQGPGAISTMVLVPAVCDAVDVPVVAAGGVADNRGFRAALALGACGVQVGTRFIASSQCVAEPAWKEALLAATEQDTELVGKDRVFMRALGQHLPGARGQAWPAGQCAGLIGDLPDAAQLVARIVGAPAAT
ncbi:2-nitropropane dioxygenase NPD [Desulfarculus baarsii DSM 2075]|uniref:2-nitropropane dioxygenase NPD n=1 Tax=Desulfarculus baarsii (strain ATCC 33931 / DSM 2075 / LMG 7858 / VKM B-1802 / 2st14) TaxID=644282 RepID=E1QKZ2_DESB2|nr:nitronate monooxygenase [Desulfarculus baarsii]ADK85257.1 2-nitropropane dioxygenase NPD [Desulfarculus baarsii DSM 2075]